MEPAYKEQALMGTTGAACMTEIIDGERVCSAAARVCLCDLRRLLVLDVAGIG
jgi:hypothetical protein